MPLFVSPSVWKWKRKQKTISLWWKISYFSMQSVSFSKISLSLSLSFSLPLSLSLSLSPPSLNLFHSFSPSLSFIHLYDLRSLSSITSDLRMCNAGFCHWMKPSSRTKVSFNKNNSCDSSQIILETIRTIRNLVANLVTLFDDSKTIIFNSCVQLVIRPLRKQ